MGEATCFCSFTALHVIPRSKTHTCRAGGRIRTTTACLKGIADCSRTTAAIATSAILAFSCLNPALATVSAPPCYNGEGPGCDASAAESPLIRELLEKSRANREKNDKAMLEKYWEQGYGDYFSFGFNKELKKNEDGSWKLVEPDDLFSGIQRRIEGMMKK